MKRGTFLTVLVALCLILGTTSCQDLEGINQTVDSDGDGWSNVQEKIAGTDPNNVDTDNDGYWDPHDPNPLDSNIPIDKGIPQQTLGLTDTPTPTPTQLASSTTPHAISPEEAAEELHRVQVAVKVMMKNNSLTRLANPVRIPTNDMHRFPDASTKHGTIGVGYVLYLHDFDGDGSPDINYIGCAKTKGTYICDEYGNVTQVTAVYE